MLSIKHVLVPVDFSEPSQDALRYGKEFAKTFNAALHLLHVVEETQIYPWASPEGIMPLPMPAHEEVVKTVQAQLEKILTDAERKQLQARLVTESGSPFVEIVRYAKQNAIDLIVIGTHGRGPIAHMLLGSVAEKVVRKASCPVLTVRHADHEFVMP